MEQICHICRGNYERTSSEIKCSSCGYVLLPAKEKDFIADIYDVKEKIERKEDFIFLDVREPFELNIAKIENTVFMPLGKIPGNLSKLNKSNEIIAFCRTGNRSHHAARFLIQKGFNAKNMDGGINMWASLIDESITPY